MNPEKFIYYYWCGVKSDPTLIFFITFHKSFYEKKIWIKHMELIALETRRKLGRVNFRIDFWDCYHPEKKNWPIAD